MIFSTMFILKRKEKTREKLDVGSLTGRRQAGKSFNRLVTQDQKKKTETFSCNQVRNQQKITIAAAEKSAMHACTHALFQLFHV